MAELMRMNDADTGRFVDFLKGVAPFSMLPREVVADLAHDARQVSFASGAAILSQDGPASEHLMIIREGRVRVSMRSSADEEVVIDTRGPGGIVGYLSMLSADKSRADVTAKEETSVYLIGRAQVLDLIGAHPLFAEYFLRVFLTKYIDRSFGEMRGGEFLFGSGDRLLFTTPVIEMTNRRIPTAPPSITAPDAARLMTAHNATALVITGEDGRPEGIVTDTDLRQKVLAAGFGLDQPIGRIMTRDLVTAEPGDFCLEAMLKMIRHDIHHLVVSHAGTMDGVVTTHDIMMLQGASPLSLVREIDQQRDPESLALVSGKVRGIIDLLLKAGAPAGTITQIVTEVNDRLVRRLLWMAEERHGAPPTTYAWIAFGSEGRKEQTYSTDQDNALVYADLHGPESRTARPEEYFGTFASWVNDMLVRCGFPPCSGRYMAGNPRWRQPLSVWKRYFTEWISTPTAEAVLSSVILFDFRPVHGKAHLADELRAHLHREVGRHELFLKFLAALTVKVRPPLGFFRQFEVEREGPHRGEINLKFRVIAPLVNALRLFSLEKGVTETSTLRRIALLRDRHEIVTELGDEIEHAFEAVNLIRIRNQHQAVLAGMAPDNFVNPDHLSGLDRNTLKAACRLIVRLQDQIARRYGTGSMM
jgi:CBS domain-containing protein